MLPSLLAHDIQQGIKQFLLNGVHGPVRLGRRAESARRRSGAAMGAEQNPVHHPVPEKTALGNTLAHTGRKDDHCTNSIAILRVTRIIYI